MTDLLLRLDELPGFDPVGLRLATHGLGICTAVDGGDVFNGASWHPRSECSVSAADPATRDAVARWLAERVGLEVGATAPWWCRWGRGWTFTGTRIDGEYGLKPGIWYLPDGPYSATSGIVVLPALASIDLADPHADWLALAAVARHVGGGS